MAVNLKRTLALLIAVVMIIGMIPTIAFAENTDTSCQLEDGRGLGKRVPDKNVLTKRSPSKTIPGKAALPASYNSNTLGYITPVRNQGSYGTCWAHGAIASCEAYMVKHGVRVGTGGAAANSMDLSELHLAWFGYTDAYDKLGLLAGDKTTALDDYRNLGGFGEIPTYTLMRWEGLASESTSALAYSRVSSSADGLDSSYAYNDNVAHVQDCVWIPTSDHAAVKEAIMEFGAGTFGYYADDGQHEKADGSYYYPSDESSNHDVTVVGWDDNYSKDKFTDPKPAGNGAWIIKNSWGTSYGTRGYYYISYYDVPSNNDTCYFYKVEPVDNYDHNYQYDGTSNFSSYYSLNKNASVANVFTAKGAETLEAVAFCNWDANMSYTCSIYKNPVKDNPSSGTPVSTKSGTFEYAGYHTVSLDTPVSLAAGDTFAVVFTNSGASSTNIPLDKTGSQSGWVSWTHAAPDDVSYYKSATGSWNDMSSKQNYRIKAYTVDSKYTVTANVNNSSYGSVSVSGSTITATPANGYYVASAIVISGTGSTSIDGNTIRVDTSSDCTVLVTFAAKTPATITFCCSYDTVDPISTYTGDTFIFPTAVCSISGYQFVGWCASEVNAVSDAVYFTPASTAIANDDATYYALFSYSDGSGSGDYVKVTNTSEVTDGQYLIVYENGSVALDSSLSTIDATSNTINVTISDHTIPSNATTNASAFTYTASNGTLLGSNGSYIGHTGSKNTLNTSSSALSNTVTIDESGNAMINGGSSYTLRYNNNSGQYRFRYYTSGQQSIQLYKKGDGNTLYTTTPGFCEHNWVESDRIDASCTEAGTILFVCSRCDSEKYEDILPLGHDYNKNGICTRCGDKLIDILSASLRLDEDIDVIYTVKVPDGASASMTFTMNDRSVTVENDGTNNFIFECVNPQCIGDNISAALNVTYNNVTYSCTKADYSIRQYCVNMLSDKAITSAMRTLLSDFIAYAEAAQTYTGHNSGTLISSGFNDSELTYSTFIPLSGLKAEFSGPASNDIRWSAAGLTLTNNVAMTFRFYAESVDGLTINVTTNGRTQTFAENDFIAVNGKTNTYEISFKGIKATEFEDIVTASFFRNGIQTSNTVSYSVNTYVCAKQNSTDAHLAALVKALYNYGASANLYNPT